MNVEQGDIVSIDFSPSKSHEPAYRHYGVVVSTWEVNNSSSLVYVVPITSTDNGYPLHVPIEESDLSPVSGFAQCEALRAMNLESQRQEGKLEIVGQASDSEVAQVLGMVLQAMGQ